MKKSAFTLIELLVVISIIAILASIALPVFGSIKEKGAATKCANNLRQLGLGLQSYLNDNDDQVFSKSGGGGAGGGAGAGGAAQTSWPVALQSKYVPSWQIFRSPFDKVSSKRPEVDKAPGVPVSYGINVNCLGTNASKFVAPSQLIVMAPAMDPGKDISFSGLSESNPSLEMPSGGGRDKMGTHANRSQINALFADTHVASLPYKEFARTQEEEGLRRWYPNGEQPEKTQ
jgi:prepilin-type N-terminal cleavage/methylation domain-containing protein/prepilin-type processing-associated H-X9-DG protein